jgi:uncharacterized protein YndB with AHSA1/START domain
MTPGRDESGSVESTAVSMRTMKRMKSFATTIEIDASRDRVWSILGDVVGWPRWTPTVTSVRPCGDGTLAPGAVFEVKQPGVPAARFAVESCVTGESFRWSSTFGGVTSRADHLIEALDGDRSRVTLTFAVEGPLSAGIWLLASGKIRRFVELEAHSLRIAAEESQPESSGRF